MKFEHTIEQIATNLINLVKEIKTDSNEVMVSSLITRKDKLNEKGR